MRSREVRFPRSKPLDRHLPPSGFLATLSTAYSLSAPCPPCFRPTASGVHPSKHFLAEVDAGIPAAPCPARRYHRPCFDESCGLSEARGLSIDLRVLPRASPSPSPSVFSRRRSKAASLGFFPLREPHRTAAVHRFRRTSSHALGHPSRLLARLIPAPQSFPRFDSSGHRRSDVPHRVWHLSFPGVQAYMHKARAMRSPCGGSPCRHGNRLHALGLRRLY
jgi:hypothetical protein